MFIDVASKDYQSGATRLSLWGNYQCGTRELSVWHHRIISMAPESYWCGARELSVWRQRIINDVPEDYRRTLNDYIGVMPYYQYGARKIIGVTPDDYRCGAL